jgi:hypothetical protein
MIMIIIFDFIRFVFSEKRVNKDEFLSGFFPFLVFPWNCLIHRLGPVESVCMLMAHALSFHYSLLSLFWLVSKREKEKGKIFICFFFFFIPNHLVRFPAVRYLISFRIDRRPSPFDRVRCDENGGPCQCPFTLRLTPTLDEFLTSLGPTKSKRKEFYFSKKRAEKNQTD